ncbi:hypothetical protein PIB30_080238 [Stylosanthes scabra]|uniref:Uncharacterized protein n=1 Tax=Stylosanthes scabra TaxID=79078 RepID=A0ABU6XPD7_9FABA|nr:hypothetical protein [Stylosanthes scabra]
MVKCQGLDGNPIPSAKNPKSPSPTSVDPKPLSPLRPPQPPPRLPQPDLRLWRPLDVRCSQVVTSSTPPSSFVATPLPPSCSLTPLALLSLLLGLLSVNPSALSVVACLSFLPGLLPPLKPESRRVQRLKLLNHNGFATFVSTFASPTLVRPCSNANPTQSFVAASLLHGRHRSSAAGLLFAAALRDLISLLLRWYIVAAVVFVSSLFAAAVTWIILPLLHCCFVIAVEFEGVVSGENPRLGVDVVAAEFLGSVLLVPHLEFGEAGAWCKPCLVVVSGGKPTPRREGLSMPRLWLPRLGVDKLA